VAPARRAERRLSHTLSLRRFCRTRGEDKEGMSWEVVEPSAREIALFL